MMRMHSPIRAKLASIVAFFALLFASTFACTTSGTSAPQPTPVPRPSPTPVTSPKPSPSPQPVVTPTPSVSKQPNPDETLINPDALKMSPNISEELKAYKTAADAKATLQKIAQKLKATNQSEQELTRGDQLVYGNLLLADQRFEEARALFEKLLVQNDRDRAVLISLALIASAQGNPSLQKKYLDKLETLYPQDWFVKNLQGQAAQIAGNLPAAQSAYEASLKIHENSEALLNLGVIVQSQKNWDQSLDYLNRAQKLDPQNDLVFSSRAQAWIGKEKYYDAENDLNSAISLSPQYPWHYLDRAKLEWLHMYKPAQAIEDLQKAIRLDPDNFFSYEYLGEVYESQDKAKEAYDAYKKVMALKPDYRYAYPAMAILAFQFKDFETAARYAYEAFSDYPGEYAFPFIRALSLRNLKNPQQANLLLDTAWKSFPRNTTISEMFRFLLSSKNDYFINDAISKEKEKSVKARLRFYQGCQYLLDNTPKAAKEAFLEASEYKLIGIPEIRMAKEWLQGLD